ncbi:TetR/AcrR family transcriptional regulator [Enterococcus caccae]|uniref:TetR family transcriptional regulator n=1 Tax=Enterococcus caccae ATCC BAA-1240 TaxID=1158612 RepID=R3WB49_9ENTE|nr:TetR/AcrR family transcriptional regulator [Enterococcus caccae]EOL45151.1 TetR family transcriptional regulator [Enterococcus caccae ATCC BAA-1240]EOT58558.1 TetR family transcriptional regulator [Enterococcus caccae ATCC BAA-1240]
MSESQITKKAISAALIELCDHKLFSKISVQDITKEVGLNRQTFYYHFTDKQDLLRWIYTHDALIYLDSPEVSIDNWEEQALKMLKAIQSKSDFYYNTVSSDSDILRTCFSTITNKLFINLFDQVDKENQLLPEDKIFYARFFSYGCSGVLIDWILNSYKESPLEIATQLFRLAKDTEFFSYRLYAQENELL